MLAAVLVDELARAAIRTGTVDPRIPADDIGARQGALDHRLQLVADRHVLPEAALGAADLLGEHVVLDLVELFRGVALGRPRLVLELAAPRPAQVLAAEHPGDLVRGPADMCAVGEVVDLACLHHPERREFRRLLLDIGQPGAHLELVVQADHVAPEELTGAVNPLAAGKLRGHRGCVHRVDEERRGEVRARPRLRSVLGVDPKRVVVSDRLGEVTYVVDTGGRRPAPRVAPERHSNQRLRFLDGFVVNQSPGHRSSFSSKVVTSQRAALNYYHHHTLRGKRQTENPRRRSAGRAANRRQRGRSLRQGRLVGRCASRLAVGSWR